ncbi:hypothetical protein DND132_1218 [Pseudodesulfovibrio mercurii]|uniref:PilZ domain-containing protein n=1 Tax=Pseudodesulfovibrio mercurii TaxID=641491 RepID=F0JCD2_9BACT|nr:PilZ domain-containing protein [Pseudodesulfovibrio mercurii]EGB14430.1 hypothetical protein DND132_1218 [Pseudodesulfovibrio mercurii]
MYNYQTNKCMHVAVKDGEALGRILNRLEAGETGEAAPAGPGDLERRTSPRWPVMLSGLVQVLKTSGEIMVFSVQIRNISIQGMLLEFMDKGHVFAGMLQQIEGLSVTFMLDDAMVTLECLPRRIVLDEPVEVGVEVSDESDDKARIQRFLM